MSGQRVMMADAVSINPPPGAVNHARARLIRLVQDAPASDRAFASHLKGVLNGVFGRRVLAGALQRSRVLARLRALREAGLRCADGPTGV